MPKIDLGKLTHEETKNLFRELVSWLSEGDLFELLNEALTEEQKEELGEQWFNIDRKGF